MIKVMNKASLVALCLSPLVAAAQDSKPVPVAPAQETGKAGDRKTKKDVDPAAQKLLDDSKEAFKKVKDLRFDVEGIRPGGGKKGKLKLVLPEKVEPGRVLGAFAITALDGKGEPSREIFFDGKTFGVMDHGKKKVLSMEYPKGPLFTADIMDLLPMGMLPGTTAELGGAETVYLKEEKGEEVAGVQCRVVKRVDELENPEAEGPGPKVITNTRTVHLGPDLLPRRVSWEFKGGPEGIKIESVLKDLKVNEGLKAEDLKPKAPEGYAQEKGTLESLGLPSPDAMEGPKLKAEVGQPAVDFKLKTPKGDEVTLEKLKGKVVILDFWATWCGPCKLAMPGLQKLHEKYKDKGLVVVGVNCMEPKEDAAIQYVEKQKFTYMQLLKGDDLAKGYQVSGIPTMILIDKEGKILGSVVGFGPDLEKNLEKQIAKGLGLQVEEGSKEASPKP